MVWVWLPEHLWSCTVHQCCCSSLQPVNRLMTLSMKEQSHRDVTPWKSSKHFWLGSEPRLCPPLNSNWRGSFVKEQTRFIFLPLAALIYWKWCCGTAQKYFHKVPAVVSPTDLADNLCNLLMSEIWVSADVAPLTGTYPCTSVQNCSYSSSYLQQTAAEAWDLHLCQFGMGGWEKEPLARQVQSLLHWLHHRNWSAETGQCTIRGEGGGAIG